MNDKPTKRMNVLYNALRFSTEEYTILKVGDRILINQERGTLFRSFDFPKTEIRRVPRSVEVKIERLTQLMKDYRWLEQNDPFLKFINNNTNGND